MHRASKPSPSAKLAEQGQLVQSLQPDGQAIASMHGDRWDENLRSNIRHSGAIEMLSIAKTPALDAEIDEPNLSLAPEEIASLTSLMKQYDQVLLDIDSLNARLQELLDVESPPKIEPSI